MCESTTTTTTTTCCNWCLLLLARVPNRRFGVNAAEGVLLPSTLALAATVFVPSVPTGVTTGHVGCLVATGAVLLTVAIDPKRSGTNRSGPRQGSLPIFSASFFKRQSSVWWVVGLIQCWNIQLDGRVERSVFCLPLLFPLDELLSRRPWVTWRSDLKRPRCCFRGGVGASIIEAMVACTLSSRVSNWVFRAGEVDTTEDKFETLTPHVSCLMHVFELDLSRMQTSERGLLVFAQV